MSENWKIFVWKNLNTWDSYFIRNLLPCGIAEDVIAEIRKEQAHFRFIDDPNAFEGYIFRVCQF
jgi:hypothetical protein